MKHISRLVFFAKNSPYGPETTTFDIPVEVVQVNDPPVFVSTFNDVTVNEDNGAQVTFDDASTSELCVYCGSPSVLDQDANRNALRAKREKRRSADTMAWVGVGSSLVEGGGNAKLLVQEKFGANLTC